MLNDREVLEAVRKYGGVRKAAKALGIAKSTMIDWNKRASGNTFSSQQADNPLSIRKPRRGAVKRFILSAAQDGTDVNVPFVRNLEAYARELDATMYIGGFTYNTSPFLSSDEPVYHASIEKYITNRRIELGPNLVFCGEMNTLPTAVNPLSGLEGYTQSKSGIFPHAKVALTTVATMKFDHPKQIMTTGAVTMPNYVQKKAGVKAEFHHAYAATLVELMPDGSFYARQLHGNSSDGAFYDLDARVLDEKITYGHRALSLTYGDIHREKRDHMVDAATWGIGLSPKGFVPLVDRVRPSYQIFHDLCDFEPRNPHNINDHHFRFSMFTYGTDSVKEAMLECTEFLQEVKRPYADSVVVESNHDNMFVRWLKHADYRTDPINAIFFLESQLAYYNYLDSGTPEREIPLFESVLRGFCDEALFGTEFLLEDESFIIGGVEHGLHGHRGANGSRGSPRQFTKIGPKVTHGHCHTPSIIEGVYTVGVSGELDMEYNKGPSSWAQTHCVQYENGKRSLLTIINGRYCA
jgi:hypothetical protein